MSEVNSQLARLYKSGRVEEAKALGEEILSKDPQAHYALFVLGVIYSNQQKYDEAISLLTKAIALESGNVLYHANLAISYQGAGEYDLALQVHRKSISLNPNIGQLHFYFAVTLSLMGDTDEAVKCLQNAINLDPQNPEYRALLSKLQRHVEPPPAKAELASQPKAGDPGNAEAFHQRVRALIQKRDWLAALEALKGAPTPDPKADDIELYRFYTNLGAGRYVAALDAARAFQKLAPYRQIKMIAGFIANAEIRMHLEKNLPAHFRFDEDDANISLREESSRGEYDEWDKAAHEIIRTAFARITLKNRVIVIFHADIGDYRRNIHGKLPEIDDEIRYRETINLACWSARLTNPQASLVLITNETADISGFANLDAVIRLPIQIEHLMYWRLRSYRALISSGSIPRDVAFIDSDICLTKDIASVFEDDFEVGLAFNFDVRQPATPIQTNVIFGSMRRPGLLIQFFSAYVRVLDWLSSDSELQGSHSVDLRFWRGDAYALAALCNWKAGDPQGSVFRIRGVRCKPLSALNYCRPINRHDDLAVLSDPTVFHFKGFGVKRLMRQYVESLVKASAVNS